jgi:hypothetical protein
MIIKNHIPAMMENLHKFKMKKAVSTVVATVLMILITVVAGLIVAQIIIPFVRENLNRSTECTKYPGYFIFDETMGGNCYTNDQVVINVKRKNFVSELDGSVNLDNNVVGIDAVLFSNEGSKKVRIPSNDVLMGDGSNIRLPKPGGVVMYNISDVLAASYLKAEVHVVLNSGRVCESPSDVITIPKC